MAQEDDDADNLLRFHPRPAEHQAVPIRNPRYRKGQKPKYWKCELIDPDGFMAERTVHGSRRSADEYGDEQVRSGKYIKAQVIEVW